MKLKYNKHDVENNVQFNLCVFDYGNVDDNNNHCKTNYHNKTKYRKRDYLVQF